MGSGSNIFVKSVQTPQGFLKRLAGSNRVVDRLLDGTPVPPMREVVYWISDGEFSGVISLRRLRNSGELPAAVEVPPSAALRVVSRSAGLVSTRRSRRRSAHRSAVVSEY
jgi:hypothetical protein